MQSVPIVNGPFEFVGALDVAATGSGYVPRRLPSWTKPQLPDIAMDLVVQMPSGVRMRCRTDARTIEVDVQLTLLRILPQELRAAAFDLVEDNTVTMRTTSTVGTVITLTGPRPEDVSIAPGPATTIRFDGLTPGMKTVEIWLPTASVVEIRDVRVTDDAVCEPAPRDPRRRWVHYGSSISHCAEASSPTTTWPAIAARDADVHLLSLGLAGQCMLDPFVARTIRDLDVDVISLKVGINVVNGDTMRTRTFTPALHGFLDTIRESHPHTPLLLVSPIFCPSAEDRPGPTLLGSDGRYYTVNDAAEIRSTCLTLTQIRSTIASLVTQRREAGDDHLYYLDGLELFGPDDAGDLPDDLHPNADGYVRMGQRFAQKAFGPGGPLSR